MKSYEETVKELLELPKFTSKNTLDHTREFLRRLGNPQNRFQIIHVAGSNGKGSVCAFLASVLKAAGKKTGLFTSPHLVEIEERFQIDGTPCRKQEFVQAAEQAEAAASMMVQEGLPHPTFFEYVFAVGMVIFAEHEIEYAVLETGMGGRLDATNIVDHPLLTVITSISLEHTEILGDTLEKIAAEKAGILKPGVPVVYDASVPKAVSVIEKRADFLHCPRHPVRPEKIKILLNTGKKIDFSYDSGYDVTELSIPFGATYQAGNAAVALKALECLKEAEGISEKAVRTGMAGVRWKGRMQKVQQDVYFDGAHNLSGIERFLEAVRQITKESAVLLFSMVKEKDYMNTARLLLTEGNWEKIVITTVPGTRGTDCRTLGHAFREFAGNSHGMIVEIEDRKQAFEYALAVKKPGQKLFCAGSLYLIGELEQITGGMQND
ncbi:MAG: bifunctional folylpolyglutamate synthase/dihydrofolate synthase [Lachnospiraceae bacterium]|nr:bifunctional folylpolyglutamate synthase/dihydrofolate synthase [Lachnospiraceae bacterium]